MDFRTNYSARPVSTIEEPAGDYLVEDAGILSDNKTRVEQMLLAGARLNEMSKYYTYDNVEDIDIEGPAELALPYGLERLEMSERLKQYELGLKARLRDAAAAQAAAAAAAKTAEPKEPPQKTAEPKEPPQKTAEPNAVTSSAAK